MNEEEQEKLYELLFKDTKNKLEETIEKQQEKNASLQKEIKLMKSININDNYINKDKIREKTKELNNEMLNEEDSLEMFYRKKYCKAVLQELLEEE